MAGVPGRLSLNRIVSHPGAIVSLNPPTTVLEFADVTALRVRVEIDERNVQMLKIGQRAKVRIADGGSEIAEGVVEQILPLMGRKATMTLDPADKGDRDVLEALIRIDSQTRWPLGLRVDSVFVD